jgi:hypothetical protein
MLNNKLLTPKILIIIFSAIGLILMFVLLSLLFRKDPVGILQVTSAQDFVSYEVEGVDGSFSGDNTFEKLKAGPHVIKAYGSRDSYYLPKELIVEIPEDKTAYVDIKLEIDSKNPDFSGVEEDPLLRKNK